MITPLRVLALAAFALVATAFDASAAVTAFWSVGANCAGANNTTFTTSGPAFQVSLCVSTTTEVTCGASVQPQAATGPESGAFNITAYALGPNFPDANSPSITFPVPINNPPQAGTDFGGTVNNLAGNPAAANQLITTLTLSPQASATNASYVISLGGVSEVDTANGANCLATNQNIVVPNLTLNRTAAPAFTSANATTFTVQAAGNFSVTATGSPTPNITLQSGALPTGVTFTPGAGTATLAGTPTQAGSFPLVFSAAGSTTVTQNFTLTVNKANQTITFANPGAQPFNASPFTLTPTPSATSGLAVAMSSTTPAVCTVSGFVVTFVAAGSCTLNANQAGNANFNAAPQVPQTFNITGSVPSAPTIGSATPGNTQATINFTASANNGGSPITSYTATCNPGAVSQSGAGSPIVVTGLTNNTLYTCFVFATNGVGNSANSGNVTVTPVPTPIPPAITSANNTTFTRGSAGTFTVTSTGTPNPTLSETGALPAGVTFVDNGNATATLSGTPALGSAASYTITISAANGVAPSPATQSFTLTVAKLAQTITFNNPGAQAFNASPITISATSTSGLVVTFSSTTPGICSVAGTSVTFMAVGNCTIVANQGGNVDYNAAAAVPQTFAVNPSPPGAPTIGTATALSGSATISFSAPANNGGSTITSYTVACNPGGITATGPSSPITVNGLTNGVTYTCAVAATNAAGTGPASGTVNVTPAVSQTWTGPSLTGGGNVTATFTGGGAGCGFAQAGMIPATGSPPSPPAGSSPAGIVFPEGLFNFQLTGCTVGAAINMTITYPTSFPSGALYYFYGPTATPAWNVMSGANVAGNTVTFSVTDGAVGDDDSAANGTIAEKSGPGFPSVGLNFQGLWWRSPAGSESGWGVNLTQQGNTLFATWFTYDLDGSGMWLVMSNGQLVGQNSFLGTLFRATGPAFSSVPFDPNMVVLVPVGTAAFSFSGTGTGSLRMTVNGVTIIKPITRQIFSDPVPTCSANQAPGAPNYQDLWWAAPAGIEAGWGVNITHQGDILFATWFTYDTTGKGLWMVMSAGVRVGSGSTYSGALYRTSGPAFNADPWDKSKVVVTQVGTGTFSFTDPSNGTFTYTVNGVTQTKNITRQVFSSPPTVCN